MNEPLQAISLVTIIILGFAIVGMTGTIQKLHMRIDELEEDLSQIPGFRELLRIRQKKRFKK
jgi:hypothetical protein